MAPCRRIQREKERCRLLWCPEINSVGAPSEQLGAFIAELLDERDSNQNRALSGEIRNRQQPQREIFDSQNGQ